MAEFAKQELSRAQSISFQFSLGNMPSKEDTQWLITAAISDKSRMAWEANV